MPRKEDEEIGGEAERPAWMLGFEEGGGTTAICVLCGATIVKSATFTSRHREWHVRHGI